MNLAHYLPDYKKAKKQSKKKQLDWYATYENGFMDGFVYAMQELSNNLSKSILCHTLK